MKLICDTMILLIFVKVFAHGFKTGNRIKAILALRYATGPGTRDRPNQAF